MSSNGWVRGFPPLPNRRRDTLALIRVLDTGRAGRKALHEVPEESDRSSLPVVVPDLRL